MNTITYPIKELFWKRLGLFGFAFFLLKGLVWLSVPVMIYLMGLAS